MTNSFEVLCEELRARPRKWLVTGAAGFIGSHLICRLLSLGQKVVALDNFSTGHKNNIDSVLNNFSEIEKKGFLFLPGDICDQELSTKACAGVDIVLHQAALGSVPRSVNDPLTSNKSNVDGFLAILFAAKEQEVKRFVYASSSSVYGDWQELPQTEDKTGLLLSPYAVTKRANELYAATFAKVYGIETIGLRYFNVFGPRQDPNGAYAAVIPRWINQMVNGQSCVINGDGVISRDFCYVKNVVQANLLAACVEDKQAVNKVYNIACGKQTSLLELHGLIQQGVKSFSKVSPVAATFGSPRVGDIQHSLASIELANKFLGYQAVYSVEQGLNDTVRWFVEKYNS